MLFLTTRCQKGTLKCLKMRVLVRSRYLANVLHITSVGSISSYFSQALVPCALSSAEAPVTKNTCERKKREAGALDRPPRVSTQRDCRRPLQRRESRVIFPTNKRLATEARRFESSVEFPSFLCGYRSRVWILSRKNHCSPLCHIWAHFFSDAYISLRASILPGDRRETCWEDIKLASKDPPNYT